MMIGDLIKAAIESVAYSLCLPYFTMLLLRRWWCAGRGLAAGRAAAPVRNWRPPPSRQILAVTRAGDTSQQSAINKRVSRVKSHVSHQSSVTIIAAMVEKHAKTKYRVLPGEHGRLKFTKAPTGDSKCAEKRKNNVINNNSINLMPVLEPMNKNIVSDQERLKMPLLTMCENNTQQLTKCFRCQKYVSDISKHQCIRPDYRQFFNDSGDLRLLKTKGILKLKRLSSGEKIFNRSFENMFSFSFSCIRHPSHVQVRALTDPKKKINFRFKIIFYTNTNDNKSTSTLGRVGTCHFAALSTHLFSTCNYVKYKIVIYVSDE